MILISRNIPLKAVRKFVEKKMGVPKKSLHSLKSTVKKIVEVST